MTRLRKSVLFDSRRTGNRVVEVDRGMKETIARIGSIRGKWPDLKVGLFGELAERALFNEFGTRTIPVRSFIRSTFDEERDNLTRFRDELIPKVLSGRLSIERALRMIGEYFALKVKEKIVLLDSPPNAPSTIRKKGFDDPLRETDAMLNGVEVRVE